MPRRLIPPLLALLVAACGKEKPAQLPPTAAPKAAPAKAASPKTAPDKPPAAATATAAPSAEPKPAPAAATVTDATGDEPLYFDRPLTRADVANRSLRELSLIRNTIFARHGNTFVKPWLDDERELRLLSARRGKWLGGKTISKKERTPLEDPTLLDGQLALGPLKKMSRRDLRLLRNTVYARHGYRFKSVLLSAYFASTDWYKADPRFTAKRLTAVDQRNLKLIRSVEDKHGGPLSDEAHVETSDWFALA